MDFPLAVSYYNSNVVSAKKNTLATGMGSPIPMWRPRRGDGPSIRRGSSDAFLKYWDRYQVPMVAENGIGQVERQTPTALCMTNTGLPICVTISLRFVKLYGVASTCLPTAPGHPSIWSPRGRARCASAMG